MSAIEVAFPVTRIKIRLRLYKGQPWSVVEHLILSALLVDSRSVAQLAAGFCIARSIVEQALIRLGDSGWIQMVHDPSGLLFRATPAGILACADENLPDSRTPIARERWVMFDRIAGHGFRLGDITHFRRADLQARRHANRIVVMSARLAEGEYRPAELLEAAIEGDEQVLGVEPTQEHATERLALVKVVDGQVKGLPEERDLAVLHAAILATAQGATRIAPAGSASGARTRSAPQSWHPVRIEPGDLVLGGPEHRDVLNAVLREASTRVIIHSTFLGEEALTELRQPLFAAVDRGVTIDILWGQDKPAEDDGPRRRPHASETLRALMEDAEFDRRAQKLRLHEESTRSHAKVIVADVRRKGCFSALISSCNWLDSPFKSVEGSVWLHDTVLVRQVLQCLMQLVHAGAGIWPALATDLFKLAQALPDTSRERQPNGRAALVIGEAHNDHVLRARDGARRSVLLTSHKLGRHVSAGAVIPLAKACEKRNLRATLLYSTLRGIRSAAASQFEQLAAASGIELRPLRNPKVHAKLLTWDDDSVVITSQNWLSADPGPTSLARELGVAIESPGLARHLRTAFFAVAGQESAAVPSNTSAAATRARGRSKRR